ncbi:MAG: hypothetical protein ABIH86_07480 [Planctomycetota bacterium]
MSRSQSQLLLRPSPDATYPTRADRALQLSIALVLAGVAIGAGIVINGRADRTSAQAIEPSNGNALTIDTPTDDPQPVEQMLNGADSSAALLDIVELYVAQAPRPPSESEAIIRRRLEALASQSAGSSTAARAKRLIETLDGRPAVSQPSVAHATTAYDDKDRKTLNALFNDLLLASRLKTSERLYGDAIRLLSALPAPLSDSTYETRALTEIERIRSLAQDDYDSTMAQVALLLKNEDAPFVASRLVKQLLNGVIVSFGLPEYINAAQIKLDALNANELAYRESVDEQSVRDRIALERRRLRTLFVESNLLSADFHFTPAQTVLNDFLKTTEADQTIDGVFSLRRLAQNGIDLIRLEIAFFSRVNAQLQIDGSGLPIIEGKEPSFVERIVGLDENGIDFIVIKHNATTGEYSSGISGKRAWGMFNRDSRYRLLERFINDKLIDDYLAFAILSWRRGSQTDCLKYIALARYRANETETERIDSVRQSMADIDQLIREADDRQIAPGANE